MPGKEDGLIEKPIHRTEAFKEWPVKNPFSTFACEIHDLQPGRNLNLGYMNTGSQDWLP